MDPNQQRSQHSVDVSVLQCQNDEIESPAQHLSAISSVRDGQLPFSDPLIYLLNLQFPLNENHDYFSAVPSGSQVQISFGDGENVEGDFRLSTLSSISGRSRSPDEHREGELQLLPLQIDASHHHSYTNEGKRQKQQLCHHQLHLLKTGACLGSSRGPAVAGGLSRFMTTSASLDYPVCAIVKTREESPDSFRQVARHSDQSNILITIPTSQPQAKHEYGSESSPFGLAELFSAELQSDTDLHHCLGLETLARDLETTIGNDYGALACSISVNETETTSTVVNHPFFYDIIKASVDCYKTGADDGGNPLDELARLHFPNIEADAPVTSTTLEDLFSCLRRDSRLDLCLEKYLHLLRGFMSDLEKLTGAAATFCEQMKKKVLVPNAEVGKSLGRRYSESDSANRMSKKKLEETIPKETDHAINTAVKPKKVLTQLLSDEQWRGAILANYDAKVLKRLKKKHLKEGRKNAKLPDHARVLLMNWWKKHTGNPYPTEEEKNMLAKRATLEIDQINNWFINQRKRHCCAIFSEDRKSHSSSCYKMTAPRR
ncbi:hypothetical protein R1sor_016916 [Riccia sorocarpa]|uniref:Homeobox domain-containing protein n=1 Tax=Riccia sorocarpa TaxID=122646 RepID=A0ABD3HJ47_9MARC